MKILFTRFPLESILNGGAEKQTIILMEELIKRGHVVAFAGSCAALIEMCRERKIPAIPLEIGPPPVTKWNVISFLWRKNKMRIKLQALIGQFHDLDCVVMLSMTEKLLLTDVAVKQGLKVCWVEHDRVGPWLHFNPWSWMMLRQSRKATTVVVSDVSYEIYRQLGWHPEHLQTIPNGVTVPAPTHSVKRESLTSDGLSTVKLGCVARLSPEKGVHILISAIATLAGLHLEVIGTGKDSDALKGLVRASNITDMVTFTDHEENIADFFQRIDVLILPSREHDPFGLVAAEAMMMGVPVIVTDACGISMDLTDKKDALIVEANNINALQEGIQLLMDPTMRERIGEAGQKTAMEKFPAQKMADAYEKVFTQTHVA